MFRCTELDLPCLKAGIHLNALYPQLIMENDIYIDLIEIFRSRYAHYTFLGFGVFCKCLGIFRRRMLKLVKKINTNEKF